MKKLNTVLAALAAYLGCISCSENPVKPAIPYDPEIEKAVEKTLAGMTLEEKVGQTLSHSSLSFSLQLPSSCKLLNYACQCKGQASPSLS